MSKNCFSSWAVKMCVLLSAFVVSFSACEEVENLPETGGTGEPVVDAVADSLVNVISRQLNVMRTIVIGDEVSVTSCELQADGNYLVTLSSGISFLSASGEDHAPMFTYGSSEESEACWALVNKKGASELIKKPSGNPCLIADSFEIKISEDKYFLVIGDQEYATDFVKSDAVQAFVCDFKADASGKVYAVTFNFAGQQSVSYYVTSYTGVAFRLDSKNVTELYVNNSKTATLVLDVPQGVEYQLAVSEGWSQVKKVEGNMTYVEITAPAQTGSVGELKVLTETGGVVMAKVDLTTEPFRSMAVSAIDVVVAPSSGVAKFAYGVCNLSAYDSEDVMQAAATVLQGGASAGCGVSEVAVSKSIVELIGGEMDPESRYVFWAVPALAGELDASTLRKIEFGAMSFDIQCVASKLLDAELKVTVKGADAVFGGVVEKTADAMTDILYQLENSILDSIPASGQNFVFEGLMSDYPAVDGYRNEIEPATTYVVWAAAAVSGEYTYTEKDVFYIEVTTNSVVDGGQIEVTMGDLMTTPSTIKSDLAAKDAVMIYYAFLDKTTGERYATADNVDKYAQMMKKSPVAVKGSSVLAEGKKLNPNTTYWLYAVAVDEDGKYGPVSCVSAKTLKLEYDTSIKLTVEKVNVTAKKAVFKVTSEGGDLSDYVYWAGAARDGFWANASYCGGDKDLGQKYMALNPEDENIKRAMNKYGALSADGTITIDGLLMETEYVFIILEKGETNYSKCGYLKVTTLAADLGVIVVEGSDQWNAAKSTIKIDWLKNKFIPKENSQMSAYYAFNFSCPTDMTAYILCASESYYAELKKMEDIMIDIENTTSRRYDNGITPLINGEHAQEPDYYKNGELKTGQLMNVYEFCAHGVPQQGFATYFAKGSHGEGNCIYWEDGKCAACERGAASIANHLTLEPWENRASQFGLEGQEAIDWANALLEAYTYYYKDAVPVIYENNGQPLEMTNPYANGRNDDGVVTDRVIVMLKDLQGNYYHPMYFEVPDLF